MELQRLGLKLFVEDAKAVSLEDFIPVFHFWIQKQIVEEHLLVDVHNYSHVHRGPGIVLVAHEGNFSMDLGDDRLGLFYYRKQDTKGSAADRLKKIVKTTLQACSRLEATAEFQGRLRFKTDKFQIVANDRLHAPNESETFDAFQPLSTELFSGLLGEGRFTTDWAGANRERFSVTVRTEQAPELGKLLERVS